MKKIIIPFISILLFYSCNSENTDESEKEKEEVKNKVSKDSNSIEEKTAEPRKRLPKHAASWIDNNLDNDVFYSERVDEMVEKSVTQFEDPQEAVMEYEYDYIKAKDLKKLNVREVIYYGLAYPCSFSQICAEGFYDTTKTPKISGYIPFSYESEEMSSAQFDEINYRRDSVVAVLIEYIEEHPDRIDIEYLRLLNRLDAYEAFPVIIKTASAKNLNNYSFLLDYMYHNEVAGLREMDFYDPMYGEGSWEYGNMVEATSKIRKDIIRLATAYYSDMNGD